MANFDVVFYIFEALNQPAFCKLLGMAAGKRMCYYFASICRVIGSGTWSNCCFYCTGDSKIQF